MSMARLTMLIFCFNPRPCEGATDEDGVAGINQAVSIHAPVKGRLCGQTKRERRAKFQSTPL